MLAVYEFVKKDIGIPIKVNINSINNYNMHWHRDTEIILVIKGSINLYINDKSYYLKEDDLILINGSEPHGIAKTTEDNIIISLKLDMIYHDRYFKDFSKLKFECKSFLSEEQLKFNLIRKTIAEIIFELNEKEKGHSFRIASCLYNMGGYILDNFDYEKVDVDKILDDEDISRMNKVIDYIEANYTKNITLQDIASEIGLSTYYTSHFIKKILGIGFTDYIGNIRLENAAIYLGRTSKSITEIALENGYGSVKSFNTNFKNRFKITPSEYRNSNIASGDEIYKLVLEEDEYGDKYNKINLDHALDKIYSYLNLEVYGDSKNNYLNLKSNLSSLNKNMLLEDMENKAKDIDEVEYIKVDTLETKCKNNYHWKEILLVSNTLDYLKNKYQNQIRSLQEDLSFKYAKLSKVFKDELISYIELSPGNITYNWDKIDEIIDFILEVKLKPGFDLIYEIENKTSLHDIEFLESLIGNFIKHILNRYGMSEVKTWYFSIVNNPYAENLYDIKSEKEYFDYFFKTFNKFKKLDNDIRVGTEILYIPTDEVGDHYKNFLFYCIDNKINLDFVCFHKDSKTLILEDKMLENIDLINEYYKEIRNSEKIEVVISNIDTKQLLINNIYDTSFLAAYILHKIINPLKKEDMINTHVYADIITDIKSNDDKIGKSFGLISNEGIKTPIYHMYNLLNKLGDEVISQGDNYFITKRSEDVQILVYNYNKSIEKENIDLKNTLKDDVLNYKFSLLGLDGDYKLMRYKLSEKYGSFYENWKSIGSPQPMSNEELSYLKNISVPKIESSNLKVEEGFGSEVNISVGINSIELVTICKEYKLYNII